MEKIAYFGAGCFWHAELVFSESPGVIDTEVGFCEYDIPGQSRRLLKQKAQVEVVKVTFDSSKTSFTDLIEQFWTAHNASDPKHKQINYVEKSVIFGVDDNQIKQAEQQIKEKQAENSLITIYTKVNPFTTFKRAPERDQKYYFKNR